ncbi:MAG: EAL domain-containing protein [Rhizobiales bacterium]|nr:EAL domain-containing protein [Hyphomicrobiales bacterium]
MYSSSFHLTNRDIDLAFEAGHLFLVFQPKIELTTGEMLCAEAYVRWNHPEYGLLPPGLFLSFFERRERSGDLTRFVAANAANAIEQWSRHGAPCAVSINLSPTDIADASLPAALDAIMHERGLDPQLLTLEVPEGAFAGYGNVAARSIRDMRRLGFRTALDGGGAVVVPDEFLTPDYFSEIKAGGGAIIQFSRRLKNAGLGFLGRRVALAASRGMEATAVGAEDETTLLALPALGFTAAQGAYICRPKRADELIGWTIPPELMPTTVEKDDLGDNVLLLRKPMEEEAVLELVEPVAEEAETDAAAPAIDEEVIIDWEALNFEYPGEEVAISCRWMDRACIFPDRRILAIIRRRRMARRLAGVNKPIRTKIRSGKPRPGQKARKRATPKKQSLLEKLLRF